MGYDPLSVKDVHQKYGGSGSFADRGQTWVDLGLGAAGSYIGSGDQNKALRLKMEEVGGLTLPAATPAATETATPATAAPSPAPAATETATPAAAAPVYNDPELEAAIAKLQGTEYKPSDDVTQLKQSVNDAISEFKNYQYGLAQEIEGALKKILDPKTFSYDHETDPSYHALRDEYIRNGRIAMLDTGAAAAAANGGRETSYGRSAAQQAYQGYMSELNSKIPELENAAYQRYRDDLDDAYKRYQLLVEDRERERGEKVDDLKLALELYENARDDELEEYGLTRDELLDTINVLAQRESTGYERGRDAITDERYEREYADERADTAYNKLATLISSAGYTPTDEDLEKAGMSKGQADALKAAYEVDAANAKKSSSSSGSGTKKSSSGFKSSTADSDLRSLKKKGDTKTDEGCMAIAEAMAEYYPIDTYGEDVIDYFANTYVGGHPIEYWLNRIDELEEEKNNPVATGKTSGIKPGRAAGAGGLTGNKAMIN
ncbi:MAG: hypothetical protein J5756_07185 [Clostridia bacterium]|nr:hypothetical protein [Clostridia bacterium]